MLVNPSLFRGLCLLPFLCSLCFTSGGQRERPNTHYAAQHTGENGSVYSSHWGEGKNGAFNLGRVTYKFSGSLEKKGLFASSRQPGAFSPLSLPVF